MRSGKKSASVCVSSLSRHGCSLRHQVEMKGAGGCGTAEQVPLASSSGLPGPRVTGGYPVWATFGLFSEVELRI